MTDIFNGNAAERKKYIVFTGLLAYFPNACAAVARHSYESNEQHNPGEPVHWDKDKSIGDGNECTRHLMDGMSTMSPVHTQEWLNEVKHLKAHAWRAMELLERKLTGLPPFDKEEKPNTGRPPSKGKCRVCGAEVYHAFPWYIGGLPLHDECWRFAHDKETT